MIVWNWIINKSASLKFPYMWTNDKLLLVIYMILLFSTKQMDDSKSVQSAQKSVEMFMKLMLVFPFGSLTRCWWLADQLHCLQPPPLPTKQPSPSYSLIIIIYIIIIVVVVVIIVIIINPLLSTKQPSSSFPCAHHHHHRRRHHYHRLHHLPPPTKPPSSSLPSSQYHHLVSCMILIIRNQDYHHNDGKPPPLSTNELPSLSIMRMIVITI